MKLGSVNVCLPLWRAYKVPGSGLRPREVDTGWAVSRSCMGHLLAPDPF